ncbi:hypothetical protein DL95DRAFT_403021 [Leptodontidium sp. 2 PMI_412]|nr:hypothetical protein DL95DRAFT_403021 [Leptodontidium sp. 2 PMI_412]
MQLALQWLYLGTSHRAIVHYVKASSEKPQPGSARKENAESNGKQGFASADISLMEHHSHPDRRAHRQVTTKPSLKHQELPLTTQCRVVLEEEVTVFIFCVDLVRQAIPKDSWQNEQRLAMSGPWDISLGLLDVQFLCDISSFHHYPVSCIRHQQRSQQHRLDILVEWWHAQLATRLSRTTIESSLVTPPTSHSQEIDVPQRSLDNQQNGIRRLSKMDSIWEARRETTTKQKCRGNQITTTMNRQLIFLHRYQGTQTRDIVIFSLHQAKQDIEPRGKVGRAS